MRAIVFVGTWALSGSAFGAEPDIASIKKQFESENYTVTWGEPPRYDQRAMLEIGEGNGHGFSLDWLRFLPGKDEVVVLSIGYRERSGKVSVKRATMKPEDYATLLGGLAVIDSVKLKPIRRNSAGFSSNDFWVSAYLATEKKGLIDLDWAGYEGTTAELEYAKPRAAVVLAQEAIKGLQFKNQVLTEEERGWASTKFARDWKKFKTRQFYWWVRERYVLLIGHVGDHTAMPTLRDILKGDLKDRSVGHAVGAVTLLLKKDVRVRSGDKVDIEKSRNKLLELLRDMR